MKTLDGRVAIVTGAAQGLGRAHALALAEQGAHVVVSDIAGAAAVAAEIIAGGGVAIAVDGDVSTMATGAETVAAAVEHFGGLHVVVNNAGILRDATIVNLGESDFDRVLAVHAKGTFSFTQAAARYWRERSKAGDEDRRSIVNTSSASGLHGNAGQLNYAAAKAAIAGMTITAGYELKRYGVATNCIVPAARTAMVTGTPQLSAIVGEPEDPEVFDRYDASNVSPLVCYLASAECRFNGQLFSVIGGHIGLYTGWSIGHEVDHTGRWSPDELAATLAAFPDRMPVRRQRMEPSA